MGRFFTAPVLSVGAAVLGLLPAENAARGEKSAKKLKNFYFFWEKPFSKQDFYSIIEADFQNRFRKDRIEHETEVYHYSCGHGAEHRQ